MGKNLFPKSKSKAKFQRPEGAGNFDNMDDFNIVQSISAKEINVSSSLKISYGTVGSVLFVGTGGKITEDNANLFWDDTNNELELGQTSKIKFGTTTNLYSTDVNTLKTDQNFAANNLSAANFLGTTSAYFGLATDQDFTIDPGTVLDPAASSQFFTIPNMGGSPSGMPSNPSDAFSQMVFDSTNNRIWIFKNSDSTWYFVTLTGTG